MKKELSIVRVDSRHYRTIAQENWGLTKEQMKGKHVHHRIAVSDGGTNDPSNLYVCGPWYHANVWHNGEYFIEQARQGAKKTHEARNEDGKSLVALKSLEKIHSTKDERGKSVVAVRNGKRNGKRVHEEKDENGKSLHAIKIGKKSHEEKDENGKSKRAVEIGKKGGRKTHVMGVGCHAPDNKGKGAKTTNSQKWVDPDHSELGEHSAPTLVQMQKRRGYPHGKENRIKVG